MSESIPKTYKACVYDKPGTLSTKVVDLETPEPGYGQVLIRLTHSGVCHSDYGVMTNSWAILPKPTEVNQVGGHEGVGHIVKMGQGTETANVKLGQRVGIKWIAGICYSCPTCLQGREGLCFNQKISGYHVPGTFQQYVLSAADYVTPVPDGLDSAAAAPMLCAGVTTYAGIKKSGAYGGDWIVIMGAGGGLGHIGCQIAARGFGIRVIGIDHGSKRDLVLASGAEHFIDHTSSKDLAADVKALTEGIGAHAVLVMTAANGAYASAMTLLRPTGTLVCIGIPEGELKPIGSAAPGPIIALEQRVVGSAIGTRKDAIETMQMAARGIVKTHFRLAKMEELSNIFQEMEDGKIQGRVVLDLQ
ncbi:GroES-like protein [Cystobasidium minutum MCA 4210]|uniref:GroES-like protein n=1 Tax=Cystobasidium minutum MCA 4210 TaxID=1397322 RepID=UPI0034CE531C|eukprot:jgi/Rhomi1/87711/CE87710_13558